VAKVAASIAEFGWRQPIVVDKQMVDHRRLARSEGGPRPHQADVRGEHVVGSAADPR
jgi:hypothetical protein